MTDDNQPPSRDHFGEHLPGALLAFSTVMFVQTASGGLDHWKSLTALVCFCVAVPQLSVVWVITQDKDLRKKVRSGDPQRRSTFTWWFGVAALLGLASMLVGTAVFVWRHSSIAAGVLVACAGLGHFIYKRLEALFAADQSQELAPPPR